MAAAISPAHAALGEALRQLREERGLSQERLGQLSQLHRNYVGSVERAERNPSFASLLKFCNALDVRVSDLLVKTEQIGMSELPGWN